MPTPDAYWLALRRVRGVGPRTCRILLDKYRSPEVIFHLDEAEIASAGIPRPVARRIKDFRGFDPLEKELCELPRLGARLLKWTDEDYPPNLREIADPPPYLFVRGPASSAPSPDASQSSARALPATPAAGWRSGSASSWRPRASPS